MREIHTTLESRDGHPLAATLYEPEKAPRAAVQINAATGVPRRYYAAYARFLAERGFAVLTYDYRGIGQSVWPRQVSGAALRMRHWGEHDLAATLDWLQQRYPGLPIAAVGHSAGGQMLGLADNNHLAKAALSIASQSGYWGHWPQRLRPVMAALWHVVLPGSVALFGRVPAAVMGAELPAGVALQWASWCRHPDYITHRSGQPIRQHFASYRGPMRFYAIADDAFYAPLNAVQALAGFYRNARTEVRVLQPADHGLRQISHFGFFRASMPQAAWQETADWLAQALRLPETNSPSH